MVARQAIVEGIGVVDMLRLCGFDPNCRSKLVRHQDKGFDCHDLLRRGWLDDYQKFQTNPVFDDLDYIISFVGVNGHHARFVGVYRVGSRHPGHSGTLPSGCPYTEWQKSTYYYELERQSGFESLEQRLVIDWGRGTLAWHQYTKNKPVAEILPVGQLLRLFSDYLDFTLTHSELRYLFDHQEANRQSVRVSLP